MLIVQPIVLLLSSPLVSLFFTYHRCYPLVTFLFEIYLPQHNIKITYYFVMERSYMLLAYSFPTIFSFPRFGSAAGTYVRTWCFREARCVNHFWFCTRLLMRGTVVPRLRDIRDLIRGRIPLGAYAMRYLKLFRLFLPGPSL